MSPDLFNAISNPASSSRERIKSISLSTYFRLPIISSSAAFFNAAIRLGVLWKSGITSNNLLPGMFFWGTSIFVFFRYHFSNLKLSESKLKFLLLLSKLSFGIYLVHDFIITLLERFGITTLSYNVFISVPLNSLVVFAVSFIIIWVISKIPFLNKYII